MYNYREKIIDLIAIRDLTALNHEFLHIKTFYRKMHLRVCFLADEAAFEALEREN